MAPVGAFGVGIGSRMAIGLGVTVFLVTTSFLGCGGGGGGGAGLGGAMIWLRISTGTTTSATFRTRPLWMAQSAAAWKTITPPAMATLRLTRGKGGSLEAEEGEGAGEWTAVISKGAHRG